jgi:alpha-beta hydrolase superfamily lysophospholipase
MVSNHVELNIASVSTSEALSFAGDNVHLAGQIDYPKTKLPADGFPVIFIIQHATCNTRNGYLHITKLGTEMGAAVFRWDKRGTGQSSSGGSGSVTVDTLRAYQTAISLPGIDRNRVVIVAQNEGSLLLHEAYEDFAAEQEPLGIVLLGNMLDEKRVLKIHVPIHIVVSKNDWNAWQIYAEAAADAHAEAYSYQASFYVATNTDRRLKYSNTSTFHRGAEASIKHWLAHTCQIS